MEIGKVVFVTQLLIVGKKLYTSRRYCMLIFSQKQGVQQAI